MKREDWPWFTGVLAMFCVTAIICVAIREYSNRQKNMMLLGYEEVAYPAGHTRTYWRKATTNQIPAAPLAEGSK